MLDDKFFLFIEEAFRRFDKTAYYAVMYGNYKAELMFIDFGRMYCMGGEL